MEYPPKIINKTISSTKQILDHVLPLWVSEIAGVEQSGKVLFYNSSGNGKNPVMIIIPKNFNPKKIIINGNSINFEEEENRFRKGGAKMQKSDFLSLLKEGENTILVEL